MEENALLMSEVRMGRLVGDWSHTQTHTHKDDSLNYLVTKVVTK